MTSPAPFTTGSGGDRHRRAPHPRPRPCPLRRRGAGAAAKLMVKEGAYALVRISSGEMRRIRGDCLATIGQVGNVDHQKIKLGKAGRKRLMGWRPTVRGSAMSQRDHPHGGGEGRSPIG